MNYQKCLANCIEMNSNNSDTFCECVNTTALDFFNYYPWYFYVSMLVTISFIVGILYVVINYSKVKEK
jgi:hypothetical protein